MDFLCRDDRKEIVFAVIQKNAWKASHCQIAFRSERRRSRFGNAQIFYRREKKKKKCKRKTNFGESFRLRNGRVTDQPNE